jgi:hypothetical protein
LTQCTIASRVGEEVIQTACMNALFEPGASGSLSSSRSSSAKPRQRCFVVSA